ncbi:Bag Family Molecular Chaperone Regulator 4 [Manis pentadactyla]|nr:Bag Family Molecular Chaperone Regulator 4 [Manis pentadactyla]
MVGLMESGAPESDAMTNSRLDSQETKKDQTVVTIASPRASPTSGLPPRRFAQPADLVPRGSKAAANCPQFIGGLTHCAEDCEMGKPPCRHEKAQEQSDSSPGMPFNHWCHGNGLLDKFREQTFTLWSGARHRGLKMTGSVFS